MEKNYEIVVLLHPDLEIDLEKPMSKVDSIIKGQKGTIIKTDIWGKRKLSYPINKQEFAVYVYYEISIPTTSISRIERDLNIADEVLRYLITYPVPLVEEDEEQASTEEDAPTSDDNENNKEDSDKKEDK